MIVNIGLALPSGAILTSAEVIDACLAHGVVPRHSAICQSDTEPTYVFEASIAPKVNLWRIADDLEQGCIAAIRGSMHELIGEEADRWGPFDPAKFIMLDGRRLSEHQLQAA